MTMIMPNSLSDDQLQELADQFNVSFKLPEDAVILMNVEELQQSKERLLEVIQVIAQQINTDFMPTAASLFLKVYSRMLCTVLKSMSVYNYSIDVSPASVLLLQHEGKLRIHFTHTGADRPETISRNLWRDSIIQTMFAHNIAPIIEMIHDAYQLKYTMLWENAYVYFHHFYLAWQKEEQYTELHAQLADDFVYITQDCSAQLFGNYECNPLSQLKGRIRENPANANELIRTRGTCCLKFRSGQGKRCKTCPAFRG